MCKQHVDSVADLAVQICEVPAPTGQEESRARFVSDLLTERGYETQRDDAGNVYARRGGKGGPALVLAAHIDTVFPESEPINVDRRTGKLFGPGVGDNSLGVAAVIELFTILDKLEITTDVDVLFVADVGEEGLGNLRGMRAAMDLRGLEVAGVIAVEGHNFGRVTHGGVGSIRWRLRASGQGGHSWGDFGEPSAIHVLNHVISDIAKLEVPREPRTTFNVGTISGGTSINTIAAHCEALVDMRSIDKEALDQLAAQVRTIVESRSSSKVSITIEELGERPAGHLDKSHRLVQQAMDAVAWAGGAPSLDSSSTDANIPLSRGIPAVCIGISRGGRGHTVDEYIEIRPIETGMAQLTKLVVDACAAITEDWKT